jgi:lipopolysaccharide export system protein LptC
MITGIGMNANLKLNQLEIHKDVQTKYQNKS